MESIRGRVHSVETFGALDGPGIRYVVFLQGCPLNCLYCHNPDSWRMEQGREATTDEIITEVLRYRSFLKGGGVTLSGGEPLLQPAFCEQLFRKCHAYGIHTALDTAGSVPLELCRGAVEQADLLLLDIKAINPDLCVRITGQDNRNTLTLLDWCEQEKKPVWIRHVVVPELTLDNVQLERLAAYLEPFSCVQRVELLPFHKMGEYKWEALGRTYSLGQTQPPTPEEMHAARRIFRNHALPVVR